MAATEPQIQQAQPLTVDEGYHFSGNPFTVERKCKLIAALREHGSIYHAAQETGCSRRAVYDWIEQDPEFAQAVSDCREDNYDDLETSVYKRAFKSDLLAMFYLKAHRPKFRDKVAVDIQVLDEEIRERMRGIDQSQLQLPAATTSFIDCVDSGEDGYQPSQLDLNTQQIHDQSQQNQKDS